MPMSLQVIYPATAGSKFDHDYYGETHLPLVSQHLGAHITNMFVTRGIAAGPNMPPGYHTIATFIFEDQAEMNLALERAQPVLDDIPNFTDVQPDMLTGEVLV